MKYLHSGYILLCERAEHAGVRSANVLSASDTQNITPSAGTVKQTPNGRVNIYGLFDLLVVEKIPQQLACQCVIGFGTPYERRQYKVHLELENPSGQIVLSQDFSAHEQNDLYEGHAIVPLTIDVSAEGCWVIHASLFDSKNENVWDVSRQFWAVAESK